MTDNGQQHEEAKPSTDELRIRSEHRQALARIESEREAELARLDLEATRRMPIAIRLFFDDRLYQRATAMAERMAEAQGITPPHLLGKLGACFAVVSKSLAWNLDPFSVAQSTYEVHGRVAYEGRLVQAVLEASGKLEGGIRAEYIGEWSKVDGKFRLEGNKPVKTWTDADEAGLGITLRCKLRGEDQPREFTFYLRQCYPRNASTWPTRPRQMMHYNAVRAFANTAAPSLLLGVPFRDELDDEPPMRDISPAPEHPRQPLVPPSYVQVYSAFGEEFSLQPGEVADWIAREIRSATGDELDALIANNDNETVLRAVHAAADDRALAQRNRPQAPAEPHQRTTASPRTATAAEPAAVAERAGPPNERAADRERSVLPVDVMVSAQHAPHEGGELRKADPPRKRGRPPKQRNPEPEPEVDTRTYAEEYANRIIGELHTAAPEQVEHILERERRGIADLPEDLRTEVVATAMDRQSDDVDDESPFLDEPPIADEHGETVPAAAPPAASEADRYVQWVQTVRQEAAKQPSVAHCGPNSPYRQGRLAEAEQWEDVDAAAEAVNAAYNARLRQLKGGDG